MHTVKYYIPIIQSNTLAVSNLWAVSGVGDEDPEEFSLTLNGFWALPHKRAVSWEGPLYGTGQINICISTPSFSFTLIS